MVANALHGGTGAPDAVTWRPLAQFCMLRLVISAAFLSLGLSGPALRPLGARDIALFNATAAAYLVAALAALVLLRLRWPRFRVQAPAQVVIDIGALTILMHASGGVDSGLGILLVPVVAGGALLLPARQGLALAALGTMAVLGEQLLSAWLDGLRPGTYAQAGLLGAGLFGTAMIAYQLAARARRSAVLAEERRGALTLLAHLNAEVIRRMQTGVILTEGDGEIIVANPSAERLTAAALPAGSRLGAQVASLGAALARWQAGGRVAQPLDSDDTPHYAPRFAQLGSSGPGTSIDPGRVLIFLEDRAALRQQAELLKLAGLGHLAGSVAHQIRNPLAAIRQALTLLEEELDPPATARELFDIAQRNTHRLDGIVREVLEMGRRPAQETRLLALEDWLVRWRDEYAAQHDLTGGRIAVTCPEPLTVRFDPGHLSQVLGNLADNALCFAPPRARPAVTITARMDLARERPAIEVTDVGPGIALDVQARLFEPFHTTRAQGTGLGLYVVEQLCTANQARVEYFAPPGGGAGFRIVCADPRRVQYT